MLNDSLQTKPWVQQSTLRYNDFGWVAGVVCGEKHPYVSVKDAMSKAIRTSLRISKGVMLTPYLCPHCGYYHLTKIPHSYTAHRYLVFGSGKATRSIELYPEKPINRRVMKIWNARACGAHDESAKAVFDASGFAQSADTNPQAFWYDILFTPVITPLETSAFHLIGQQVPVLSASYRYCRASRYTSTTYSASNENLRYFFRR